MTNQEVMRIIRAEKIREISRKVSKIVTLHNILTCEKGNYFHLTLLCLLENKLSLFQIEELRINAGLNKTDFHLDKLMSFKLVGLAQEQREEKYQRNELGQTAVKAVQTLESKVGKEAAKEIYDAYLDPNSTRLFLHIFDSAKELDFTEEGIKYSQDEVIQFSSFLPKKVLKIAAIDKLIDATLLNFYDRLFYLSPLKSNGFYRYLIVLNEIIKKTKHSKNIGG